MVVCGRCQKEPKKRHDHHIIPKGLYELLELQGNPDAYRIIVCGKCHGFVSAAWVPFFERIGLIKSLQKSGTKIDDLDTAIEEKYGIATMNFIWEFLVEEDMKELQAKKIPVWLDRLIKNGVGDGKRHVSRFVVMINLKERGFPDTAISDSVVHFNEKCRPPENRMIVARHIKQTLRDMNARRVRKDNESA